MKLRVCIVWYKGKKPLQNTSCREDKHEQEYRGGRSSNDSKALKVHQSTTALLYFLPVSGKTCWYIDIKNKKFLKSLQCFLRIAKLKNLSRVGIVEPFSSCTETIHWQKLPSHVPSAEVAKGARHNLGSQRF